MFEDLSFCLLTKLIIILINTRSVHVLCHIPREAHTQTSQALAVILSDCSSASTWFLP